MSGIIVTGRSALAISRSLVASWRPWPHSRRKDAVAAKQRTVAYQSGRGQREGTDVYAAMS